MYYGKPDNQDFIFTSGGYKCAIGLNFPNGREEPHEREIRMVKTRIKGGSEDKLSDWEIVHAFWTQDMQRYTDAKKCMEDFLVIANPKLKAATGSEVPPMPTDFLEQIEWIINNSLGFNAQTGEVFIKV